MMTTFKKIWIVCAVCAAGFMFQAGAVSAQSNSNAGSSTEQAQKSDRTEKYPAMVQDAATKDHDGQHDFDFELGSWKIHLSRRLHPLTGSNTWVEFDGTSVTRKVWDGRADLEEFETAGSTAHVEGLTLRVYNPQNRQWSIYWANSKDPALGQPIIPMVGGFRNGRGEFYDQEKVDGKAIYVRFIWSEITPNSAHFEQSFSEDGGKTWEVNWITDQTRVNDSSK